MRDKGKDGRRLPSGAADGCGYNCVNFGELDSPRRGLFFAGIPVEELEAAIEEYFREQERQEKPPTIAGLGWWLGCARKTLCDYARLERDSYEPWSFPIQQAYRRIEAYLECQLCKQTGQTSGLQFVLKNNFGWQDKQEIELSASRVENLSDEELQAEIARLQLVSHKED